MESWKELKEAPGREESITEVSRKKKFNWISGRLNII